MGRKIKYLGSSHVREIAKGTNFGGRLAEPTTKDIEWNLKNNHLIDSDDVELSDTALDLLLEDPEFKDVSDMARVPTSLGQQLWQGAKKTEHDAQGDVPAQVSDDDEPPSATGEADNTSEVSEASPGTPPSPGGSTAGGTGGRRGRTT